jgi:hypothetical protein
MPDYKFTVSPSNIKSDLSQNFYLIQNQDTVEAVQIGVYSSMTQVVTGGINGNSIMTGLTVPIMLTQTTIDMGYYSPFDGAAEQSEVTTNFVFSSTTSQPYTWFVFNTSQKTKSFLEFASYTIDWGDGSPIEIFQSDTISHTYPLVISGYTITMVQTTPFGVNTVTKEIKVPFQNVIISNPLGRAFFTPLGGSWSNTPISYDYIYPYDADNTINQQISSNYVTVPFVVSGNTTSRVSELIQYGPVQYQVGVPVIVGNEIIGAVTDINPVYTAYTINGVNYYDYIDGQTIYFENSSGVTEDSIVSVPITKEPILMKIVDQPQIISDVYVERGKSTAYEQVRRMGEVNNLSAMINYGYGYFFIEKKG